eukprot:971089_1
MSLIDPSSDSDDLSEFDEAEFEENEDETFDALPHFANDENKKLHAELKEKEKHLLKLTQNVTENKNRISIMSEHMKNVENELAHCRQILLAKNKEIETEKHMALLAQKEKDRLSADNKKSESQIIEYQNRLNNIHNQIFQVNEKIESFKLKMNWKNEELQQWTLAAKQKEEDQIALEKYQRADELKIKNLNIELETVSNQHRTVKTSLENEITETKAVQVELDATAQEFKKLHSDRNDIIHKWDHSVQNIHKKDEQIIDVTKKVGSLKTIIHQNDIEIEGKKQMLNGQLAYKKHLTQNIEKLHRNLEHLRKDSLKHQERLKNDSNEAMLVENEISKMENENKLLTLNITNLTELNEKYLKKINKKERKLKSKMKELDDAKQNLFDTEKETNNIDMLLNQHQQNLENIIKMENKLKESLIKQQSILFDLTKNQQRIQNDIRGTEVTTKNLLSKIDELDKRSLAQNESLYALDFQIQQLSRKVSRASGKRSREEQIELNEKIQNITNKLEIQKKHEHDLLNQVKKFSDDLRNAKKCSLDIETKKRVLQNRISEIILQNESIEEEIHHLNKKKNELFIGHDEEKLNVHKIKNSLHEITGKVFVLESKKVELRLTAQKQMNEIEQINKMNATELKNKQNILHSIKMEHTKCQQKINTLKAKYSTLSAHTEGEDGENEHSQVYVMIKMAQTKQELTDKGNSLDKEIRVKEKELKLLFKSLRHLNHGNALYRKSLHTANKDADEDDETEQLKMELTNKYRKVTALLHKRKDVLKELKNKVMEDENAIVALNQQTMALSEYIHKYEANESKLDRKLKQQKEKLKRAQKELSKIMEREQVNDNPSLQLKDLKRKQKSMVETLKYLDDILQTNNIHIEELAELTTKQKRNSTQSDRRSSSGTSSSSSSVVSSRPSTSSTVASSSSVSIVSLSPQF